MKRKNQSFFCTHCENTLIPQQIIEMWKKIDEKERYDVEQDPWYSPHVTLDVFEKLRSRYGKYITEWQFKKAHEMFSGAITSFGAFELDSSNKYWIQVNKQSTNPDIMGAKLTERPGEDILCEMAALQMKEFEEHANTDDIVAFIQEKALKKDYMTETIIVCINNRKGPMNTDEINRRMMEIKPIHTIYIIGRPLNAPIGEFIIYSPAPRPTKVIQFNVNTTAKKFSLPWRIKFHQDEKQQHINYDKTHMEPFNLFEMMGLDQKVIEGKFGKFK